MPKKDMNTLVDAVCSPSSQRVLPQFSILHAQKKGFGARLIRDGAGPLATIDIIKHLSWEERKRSKVFMTAVKEAIHKATQEQFRPYFRVIKHIMQIQVRLLLPYHFSLHALMTSNHCQCRTRPKIGGLMP
jgi:hypothetical protein